MYKKVLFLSLSLAGIISNLLAQTTKLSEVVVTAKSHKSIKDLQGAVTVITASEIEKINATNIKDILVKTSGIVEVGSGINGRKHLSIRGTRPQDVLILIDGKKANRTADYVANSDFAYSQIPISMIERIEVIKGAKSSIYGSDAMGGVINIITKKDARTIWADIDLQTGSSWAKNGGDEQNFSANIGGNVLDKLSFVVGVSKYNKDETYGKGFDKFKFPRAEATYIEGIESLDGNLKLKYNIDDTQSAYISYLKGEEKRKERGNSLLYNIERDYWSTGYEKNFEKVALSLDFTKATTDVAYKESIMPINYTHKLENYNLKAEAKITAINNNYIVIGAETMKEQYSKYNPTTAKITEDFDIKANAYYIQDEIDIRDFIFTFGTVLDDNEKYGNEFSSNVGIVYKIDDKQRLKVSYAQGFKAPDVKKGNSKFYANSTYGNDDLKPETSQNYELAYEFYGNDTLIKTAVFSTKIDDMIAIERNVMDSGTKHQYRNTEKADIKGFETEAKYHFTDNHSLNVNYTFLETENKSGTNKGKELTYRPKSTLNIGLSSDFGYGISSYLSANYIGKHYIKADNSESIEAYTLVNTKISKKVTDNFILRLGVDNLFDKKFEDESNDTNHLQRRLVYIGMNYKF